MAITTLYDCLSYIIMFQLYTSAAPLQQVKNSYRVTRFGLWYTIVVAIGVLMVLFISIRYKMMASGSPDSIIQTFSPLAIFVGCLEIQITVMAYVVSNVMQHLQKFKHIALIDQLHELDVMLIKEFRVKLNYFKMIRKNVILLCLFFLYCITLSITILLKVIVNDFVSTMLIGVCYIFISLAPGVSSYGAMNFADLLRVRFRLMQKLLRPEYMVENFPDEKVRERKIAALIQGYRGMFKIIQGISDVFGMSLLMMHFHDLTLSTSQMYFVYLKSTEEGDNTELFTYFLFWMLPIVWKTCFLPMYMHVMMNEAEACIPGLSHADDHTPTENAKAMVQTFTMWNRHNKTKISIAGFFQSDLSLAFAMWCGVASYLLVLIQFKMQEDENVLKFVN